MLKLSLDSLDVVSFDTLDSQQSGSEPALDPAVQVGGGGSTEPFCDTDALQVCTKFCLAV